MTQTPNSNPNPAPDNADSPDSTDSPDDTSAHTTDRTTDPTEAGEPHGTGHAVALEDPVEAVEEELAAEEF